MFRRSRKRFKRRRGSSFRGQIRTRRFGITRLKTSVVGRSPFPNHIKVTHRYVSQAIGLDPGVDIAAHHFFACNNLNQPDQTGVGHQPMGFDQFRGLYDHYIVIGAKCTVRFITTSQSPIHVGLMIVDTIAAPITNIRTLKENGNHVSGNLAPIGDDPAILTLTKGVNIGKWVQTSHPLSDDRLKGNTGTPPAEQIHFDIFAGDWATSANPNGCVAYVEIDYITIWMEPVVQTGS